MGAIEVSCANQECGSDDVEIITTKDVEISVLETKLQGSQHTCRCNCCNNEFLLFTGFSDVKILQEVR